MVKREKPAKPASNLWIELVPLSEISRWPRNPKQHDEDGIATSIERFGFNDPPALDEGSGRLVEGHGRIDALVGRKARGESPPARVEIRDDDGEWLVPVLRGIKFKSELEAEAYLIAHNRLNQTGGWDEERLQEILSDIAAQTESALAGVGFTTDDLDRLSDTLIEAAGANPGPPPEFPPVDPTEDLPFCCPKCGYSWSGNPR